MPGRGQDMGGNMATWEDGGNIDVDHDDDGTKLGVCPDMIDMRR